MMNQKTSDSITGWAILAAIAALLFALSSCSGVRQVYPAPEIKPGDSRVALEVARHEVSLMIPQAFFWESDSWTSQNIDGSRWKVVGIYRAENQWAGIDAHPFEVWVNLDYTGNSWLLEWYAIDGIGSGYTNRKKY